MLTLTTGSDIGGRTLRPMRASARSPRATTETKKSVTTTGFLSEKIVKTIAIVVYRHACAVLRVSVQDCSVE
jgi:hypothetical protein